MTRRTFVAAAAVTPMCAASGRDLLKRVASLYGDTTQSFAAVGQVSSAAGAVAAGRISMPAQRSIHYQDGLYRLETRVGDRWLFVRGENDSWIYRSDRNVFKQGFHASEVGREVQAVTERAHDDLGRRFGLLNNLTAEIREVGEQEVRAEGRKILCAVLSIHPHQEAWREKLWIEEATAIVWKSVTDTAETARNLQTIRTVEWKRVVIGATIPPETFQFTPPKKARLVRQFDVIQHATPPPLEAPHSNP